jgi:sugar phosphate permease
MGRDDITSTPPVRPAPPALMRPSRGRYLVLGGLCLLALLTYVQRVGFASTGTALKRDLGLSGTEWGLVMAAFLVAYALFEVPWGVVGDRLGARHLLAVLVLGWSLATAALALLALLPPGTRLAFALLLALRFTFGLFQAGGFPAISRAMTDWAPTAERGTAQGVIWALSRAGGALAPLVVISGSDGENDWPLSFLLLAALGAVWCAAFWPWFRNRPEQASWVNDAERALIGGRQSAVTPPVSFPSKGRSNPDDRLTAERPAPAAGQERRPEHLGSFGSLLSSSSAWALSLMYGFGGLSATFFITLLPVYLLEQRGLSSDTMRLLSGLPLACGVVGCLVGGIVSDGIIRRWGNRKWGRRLSGMFGHVCAGLALLATGWVESVWLLAALLSLTFFCNDLAMGPAWACCADIGERYAGTLGGMMNTVGNLGGALGAVVAGSLMGKVFLVPFSSSGQTIAGNELVFVVFAASFWMAALCWLGVDASRKQGAAGEPARR